MNLYLNFKQLSLAIKYDEDADARNAASISSSLRLRCGQERAKGLCFPA